MKTPIGPFTPGWSISSEPLHSSELKRMQGYACLRVDVKLHGCTPNALYTAGINVYGADEPTFGGVPRLAFDAGIREIDGISKYQVNAYIIRTKRTDQTGYVKFRRILPVKPGTYDVQVWIAKGTVESSGELPSVCYKSGATFGDSQKVTIASDSSEFRTPDYSHRMLLSPITTSAVSSRLLLNGVWEPVATDLVKDEVSEGDVVLDIGAHIGYYTLIFAKLVGRSGRVFAFEPDPTNFALLEKNVRMNGYSNVTVVQMAVAQRSELVSLFLEETQEAHSIVRDQVGRQRIDVRGIRLDDYFHADKRGIDFIKIDIEGGEPAAIEGMTHLLERNSHVKLLTEFFPGALHRADGDPTGYLTLLREHGFEPLYHLNELEGRVERVDIANVLKAFGRERNLATNLFCVKSGDRRKLLRQKRRIAGLREESARVEEALARPPETAM
jgi:FkbM family methyltransferase